jgi:hypothetical protein
MNHAIHMAAVTQIRQRHSAGRAYFDKKIAEGKTGKEASAAGALRLGIHRRGHRQRGTFGSGGCLKANHPGT